MAYTYYNTTIKMTMSPLILCIPRVECTVTKDYIHSVFSKLKIGKIESVQEIPLCNGSQYKRIIVKISWIHNDISNYIQTRLLNDQTIKIVHSMPWYWLCVKYIKNIPKKLHGPDPTMMKMSQC